MSLPERNHTVKTSDAVAILPEVYYWKKWNVVAQLAQLALRPRFATIAA
jgi:hypothetical protein